MQETIVIPDVHGRRFWRSAVMGKEDERVIFLGDYVDPYHWEEILAIEAFREFCDIISFKKSHPDNVVLLLGNHDLGYLDRGICECRMDYIREKRIREVILDNLDLFDIVHKETIAGKEVLFSHAGIAEGWVERNAGFFPEGKFDPMILNDMLHDKERRTDLLFILSQVSWYRSGDDKVGSPIWADLSEYLDGEKLLEGYFHIFGHTLHHDGPTIVHGQGLCIDCAKAFTLGKE